MYGMSGAQVHRKNNCFFPLLLISSLNNFDGFDPQYEIQAQLHIHHVVLLSRAKKGPIQLDGSAHSAKGIPLTLDCDEYMNKNWFRSKTVVFGFIFLMMVYVLYKNERFLIRSNDPIWNHYQTFKWWLLAHGVAGASALLLGPMQFSDRLRRRYSKLHRIVGRVYVAGALIAAPIGALIQYRFDERLGMSRSFTIATIVDATLWMLTTLIALAFALRGKIQQHSQWMTRSYAVAIVFLEVRVVSGIGGWNNNLAIVETILWVCLALSLLFGDIAIHWRDLRTTRTVPAKAILANHSRTARGQLEVTTEPS